MSLREFDVDFQESRDLSAKLEKRVAGGRRPDYYDLTLSGTRGDCITMLFVGLSEEHLAMLQETINSTPWPT